MRQHLDVTFHLIAFAEMGCWDESPSWWDSAHFILILGSCLKMPGQTASTNELKDVQEGSKFSPSTCMCYIRKK